MGRVSDALERASTERPKSIPKSQVDVDGQQQVAEPSKTKESDTNAGASLGVSRTNSNLAASGADLAWPLTKRIQRFIFGRGLASIKEFPLVFQEANSFAGEQYKILREQLKKIYNEDDSRLLAIMSPVKGDGKSTVAANLAGVIALDYQQQVLLIDADLRSPSIHNFFGIKSTPGLADYLSSESGTNIWNYVQHTSLHGLRVIAAGKATHLSAELLATQKMRSLLRDIPKQFPGYQVIIDTSPVLSTSDPLVLAQQLDKVVLVVRAGATPRECLSEAIKSLGAEKVSGIILNGADLGASSRYYYYGHSS